MGPTEILVLVAMIAAIVAVPRLQRRLEQRVDEGELGRKTLEALGKRAEVHRVREGLAVDILAEFGRVRKMRIGAYEVHASDEAAINAIALPGGFVVLTAGLLELLGEGEMTPDELAGVLAHEVGHIELGHSREAEVRETMTKWASRGLSMPGAGWIGRAVMQAGMSALRSRASRDAERAADAWAQALLRQTQYRDDALETFLLKTVKWSRGGGLWSTHPAPTARVAALRGSE